MDSSVPREAVIAWEGDSKEVISSFPDKVKSNLDLTSVCCNRDNGQRTIDR